MGQGFRQPSGVDQGGNPWYDPDYDKDIPSYRDDEQDEYVKILHKVPINLMIKILRKFGYKVIAPDGEEK